MKEASKGLLLFQKRGDVKGNILTIRVFWIEFFIEIYIMKLYSHNKVTPFEILALRVGASS